MRTPLLLAAPEHCPPVVTFTQLQRALDQAATPAEARAASALLVALGRGDGVDGDPARDRVLRRYATDDVAPRVPAHLLASARFSADRSLGASANEDGGVTLWRAHRWVSDPVTLASTAPDRPVSDLVMTPDGSTLAALHTGGVLESWDLRDPRPSPVVHAPGDQRLRYLSLDPTGRIAVAWWDRRAAFWDLRRPATPPTHVLLAEPPDRLDGVIAGVGVRIALATTAGVAVAELGWHPGSVAAVLPSATTQGSGTPPSARLVSQIVATGPRRASALSADGACVAIVGASALSVDGPGVAIRDQRRFTAGLAAFSTSGRLCAAVEWRRGARVVVYDLRRPGADARSVAVPFEPTDLAFVGEVAYASSDRDRPAVVLGDAPTGTAPSRTPRRWLQLDRHVELVQAGGPRRTPRPELGAGACIEASSPDSQSGRGPRLKRELDAELALAALDGRRVDEADVLDERIGRCAPPGVASAMRCAACLVRAGWVQDTAVSVVARVAGLSPGQIVHGLEAHPIGTPPCSVAALDRALAACGLPVADRREVLATTKGEDRA